MLSARFQAIRGSQSKVSQQAEEKSDNVSASSESIESEKDSDEANTSTDDENAPAAKNDLEDVEEDDEEEDRDVEIGNATSCDISNELTFVCEALGDYIENDTGFTFSRGDLLTVLSMREDDWWEVENQDNERGVVPSTFLKVPEKIKKYFDGLHRTAQPEEKGHFWSRLRNTVKQAHTFEEALTAMGALPVGFSDPSLAQLLEKDFRYSTEAFVTPKLSETGLSFKDIKWSNDSNSIKLSTTHLQRAVRLVAFRQIHPPGPSYEVTSRYVRVCLHDGSKVLSNIHTIRASWDPKAPKIWTFLPKIPFDGCCLDEGQFFIRSNSSSATIGVLFQLCVGYKKADSEAIAEMSCGWVFMRLLDDSGLPVPNRTKVLRIHSGVPFVNQPGSPLAVGSKEGALKNFISKNKCPRLFITITALKRKTDQLLTLLPTALIGPISSIPLLVMFRKVLADKLLKDRTSFDSAELIQSSFLSNFPKLFSQPDILDAFRKLWNDRSRKLKQSAARTEDVQKEAFQQIFNETAYLILQCSSLPKYSISNHQTMLMRKSEIMRIMKLMKEQGPLSFALSPDFRFRPLAIQSLSFNIIGPYSQQMKVIE